MTYPHQSRAVRRSHYTATDSQKLTEMFHQGQTWAEIGAALSRTVGSVRQRAYVLGLRRYEDGNAPKPDPSRKTIYNRAYQARNPEKRLAHKLVEGALNSGDMKKHPCEFCGSPDVHAHHADYDKPLDVNWLCCSCHARVHSILRKTKASPSNHSPGVSASGAFSGDRG